MAVALLPLEDVTDKADAWRSDIQSARDDLAFWWLDEQYTEMQNEDSLGLPEDDLLRFRGNGERVPEQELSRLLDSVINSWV
tara:strand:- start:3664 stop:3909 length:246 start_codon:yes stop_codon:yes gene_type:complete